MKNLILIAFFLLGFSNSIAQTYPLESIPTELKQNAYAVIQKAETQVELHSLNKVVQTRTWVITVLEKAGDDIAQPVQIYSPSLKINELEAIYYDQNGKQIKKFKERDFMDYSYIANGQMYTDDRVKFLNFTPSSYPYTVYFKSVVTSSNATLGNWFPVIDYNVSILNSTYTIHNKSNLKILSKELNLKEYGIQSQNPNQSSIRYELKNFTAIEEEDLAPHPYELLPIVIFSTNEFVRDGIKGSFTNWKELGLWYNELIKNTNDLTPAQKSFFQNLVKDAKTDREKVQILYKYLQNKTRYIGVQLGIGGLKPFPASYVESKSYGDCKALTNYMQSILEAVGIPSYYTVVYAGSEKQNMLDDFASLEQGNHVILYVPLKDEDIWLETTSQQIGFNFLGDFTDDRNVLALYPDGGKIIRTPKYSAEQNTDHKRGRFQIFPDGKLHGSITSTYTGIQYDYILPYISLNKQDLKASLNKFYYYLPNLNIKTSEFEHNWEDVKITHSMEIESPGFAKVFGSNMSVNIVPVGVATTTYKRKNNRKFPLLINRGFTDNYEFEIKLPGNYKIDGGFDPIVLDSEFGKYQLIVTQKDKNTLLVKRHYVVYDGTYAKEKYNDYVEFTRKVSSFDMSKILLEKL